MCGIHRDFKRISADRMIFRPAGKVSSIMSAKGLRMRND
jgi:hypothetical protein